MAKKKKSPPSKSLRSKMSAAFVQMRDKRRKEIDSEGMSSGCEKA